jgi:hypothetical protein
LQVLIPYREYANVAARSVPGNWLREEYNMLATKVAEDGFIML